MIDVFFSGSVGDSDSKTVKLLLDLAKAPLWVRGDFSLAYQIDDYCVDLPAGLTMYLTDKPMDIAKCRSVVCAGDGLNRDELNSKVDLALKNNLIAFVDASCLDMLEDLHKGKVEIYKDSKELIDKIYGSIENNVEENNE